MVTFHVNSTEIGVFLAILLRLSIVLFMLPIFSSNQVPSTIKASIVLALSTMVYFLPHESIAPLPFETFSLLWVTIGEIIFGIIMGLTILLVLGAFQFAGELISFQMGFGFAQVADPQNGAQTAVMSRWFQIVATLLFFSMNGHHVVIKALVESFRTIPIGGFTLTASTYGDIVSLSGQLFVIAIRMAAPVMIALLMTHVALGLMARFAPQLNVISASFPLTILLGFFFLALSASFWGSAMEGFLAELFQFIRRVTQ